MMFVYEFDPNQDQISNSVTLLYILQRRKLESYYIYIYEFTALNN